MPSCLLVEGCPDPCLLEPSHDHDMRPRQSAKTINGEGERRGRKGGRKEGEGA